MTHLGGVGCALIGLGPCLILFIFTVASSPIKVIVLTASGFFWLIALLLSSVIWFIVTPLRTYLVFGLIMAIIVQEAMRFVFFKLIIKADTSLQFIATGAHASAFRSNSRPIQLNPETDPPRSEINEGSSANSPSLLNQESLGLLAPVGSPTGIGNLFNYRIVAYVSGLGFGLMSCVVELLRILLDSYGPGVFFSAWESKTFFVVASCESMCMSLMQILWSLMLFTAFAQRSYGMIVFVYLIHLGLSCLSLLNTQPSPWPEVVCTLYVVSLASMTALTYFSLRVKRSQNNSIIVNRFTPGLSYHSSSGGGGQN